MDLVFIFGLLSGIVAFFTYILYFRQTLVGKSNPNPITWLIWLIVGLINAITYFSVTRDNIWQSSVAIVAVLMVALFFVYSLVKGKFTKMSWVEITALVMSIIVGIFWQITANDRLSNVLLQVIFFISYIPTFSAIIQGRAKEHYFSWIFSVTTYVLMILSLVFDPTVDWIAYVHPVVKGIIGNGGVFLLALIYHKRDFVNVKAGVKKIKNKKLS